MSKKVQLPRELRIEKSKRDKKLYDRSILGANSSKKNGLTGAIIFVALAALLIIFFQGNLEVIILVIAFIGLVLLARWFFNR